MLDLKKREIFKSVAVILIVGLVLITPAISSATTIGVDITSTGYVEIGSFVSDPVAGAANGQIIYNSTTNKFRCYESGSWVDCISSVAEIDPVFLASVAAGILAGDIINWNTAFGWGDHAGAGYLTSYTETDPVVGALTGIIAADGAGNISAVTDNSANWNTAFGWGDHSGAGYLTAYTETDPVVGALTGIIAADGAGNISSVTDNSANWNTAFGWGDHSGIGYLTAESDPVAGAINGIISADGLGNFTAVTDNSANWNTAFGWGDHSGIGYLTAESDPVAGAINGIISADGLGNFTAVTDNSANWNTAFGWGDHGAAGYQAGDADLTTIAGLSCGANQILKISGGVWTCQADATGGSINSFETMSTPAGTSPVAESSTDTLNITAGSGLAITGTAGTDTIDFAIADLTGDWTVSNNNITLTNGTLTANTITDGTFSTTGGTITGATWNGTTLGVGYGGLGGDVTAIGAGEILYSTGAAIYDSLAAGTSGYLLQSNGAGAPSWLDVSGWDQDSSDDMSNTLTSANIFVGNAGNVATGVVMSGDVSIDNAGATSVNSVQANAVALATDTTGDYAASITGGNGIASTGATTGENISHTLSVALQANKGLEVDGSGLSLIDCGDTEILKYSTGTGQWTCQADATGGSINSFETMSTTSGTSPVADSSTDTLNITAGSGLAITGTAGTDTIDFAIADLTGDWTVSNNNITLTNGTLTANTITDGTFSTTGGTITGATWNGTTLGVGYGGLGGDVTAIGAGEILYSTGAAIYDSLAAGTSGYLLQSNGAGAPSWLDVSGWDQDSSDDMSNTLTSANIFVGNAGNVATGVVMSGDVSIDNAGATSVNSVQANAVALATDTTGDYAASITGGNGIASTGATTGENISHTLSVALQANKGLEVDGSGLSLIDCGDTEILKYSTGTGQWTCQADATGGSINSFETMSTTSGTSPVADSSTDTLNITAGSGLAITGTAGTDTIDFAIADLTGDWTVSNNNITLTNGTLTANTITDGTFSTTGGTITGATWNGTTLGVGYGGLGGDVTAIGAGEILYSTGAAIYDSLAAGTSGYLLQSNGAGAPSWLDVSGWDQDSSDDMSNTLTSANIFVGNAGNVATGVVMSGDVSIDNAGATSVNSVQADAVALATDTTGDYAASITGGNGIASTGATTGENISHTLSVALQANKGLEVDGSGLSLIDCGDTEILKYSTGTGQWTCQADATGGSINSFETMSTTSGTSPVADSSTDTLNITAGSGLAITGTAGTDTIDFAIADLTGDWTVSNNNITLTNGTLTANTITDGTFSTTGGTITGATWNGTTLGVGYGGLGGDVTAIGAGEILYSTGAAIYDSLAAGTSGYLLQSNGAGAPSWLDVSGWDQDSSDDMSNTLTSANIFVGNAGNVATGVVMSGDVSIDNAGATSVNSVQADAVALATDTTGDYAASITGGNGIASTGATTGENISHTLSVALQANKGLEVDGSGLSLIDCGDTEILKYSTGTGQWSCQADATGGSTAWDAIGDPSGNGAVAMAETAQTLDWNMATDIALDGLKITMTNDVNETNTQQILVLQNVDAAGTGGTETLLLLDNADTDEVVADGLLITSAAGTMTDAIDVSDADIVNAINVGANTILGTTAVIDFTNFDVTGAGDITANSIVLTTALDETDGGTGTDTYTTGDMLYSSAANTLSKLTVGTNGQCLTSNGTIPVWGACTGATISKVRAYDGTATAVQTTWTKISFDTESFDTGNEFTGGTFTATNAGYYQVNARTGFVITGDKNKVVKCDLAIYKQGTIYALGDYAGEDTTNPSVNVADIVDLTAGQTIDIYAQCPAGAQNTTTGATEVYVSIHQIL